MTFLLFGLTGGIASGKSTVASHWRTRGLPVLDADQLAREIVLPGTEGLATLVATFGEGILAADGTLDRKAVAALVFADPPARKRLEAIMHPRIAAAGFARAQAAEAEGHLAACYEAALLVESGAANMFRPLVVVTAPEETQIVRAAARDGVSEDEVRARLRAQLPMAQKAAAADHVIDNVGDRRALVLRADEVLDAILQAAGIDVARYPRGQP